MPLLLTCATMLLAAGHWHSHRPHFLISSIALLKPSRVPDPSKSFSVSHKAPAPSSPEWRLWGGAVEEVRRVDREKSWNAQSELSNAQELARTSCTPDFDVCEVLACSWLRPTSASLNRWWNPETHRILGPRPLSEQAFKHCWHYF